MRKINFRQLWNCCWDSETHVIEFDGGELHAVCKSCAYSFASVAGQRGNIESGRVTVLADSEKIAEDRIIMSDAGEGRVTGFTTGPGLDDYITRTGIVVEWSAESGGGVQKYEWAEIFEHGFTFKN